MGRAIELQTLVTNPDGSITVQYNAGGIPLPAGITGEMVFGSLAQLKDAINELAKSPSNEQLLLLHLAITWLKPDGSTSNTNQVLNKQLQFDPWAQQALKIV